VHEAMFNKGTYTRRSVFFIGFFDWLWAMFLSSEHEPRSPELWRGITIYS